VGNIQGAIVKCGHDVGQSQTELIMGDEEKPESRVQDLPSAHVGDF
jgi:hypothetical protein